MAQDSNAVISAIEIVGGCAVDSYTSIARVGSRGNVLMCGYCVVAVELN